MPQVRTRLLLVAATLMSGILAGGIIDRVIVGGPAWSQLGAEAWQQYSRRADFGTGLVAYPIEGIGSALLIIAAAVSNYLDGNRRRWRPLTLYFAVGFSMAGLLLTVKAAPIMLGLAKPLFGAADTLAFIALVWALSAPHRVDK